MVNAQKWLNQNYPKEQRSQITELSINEEMLDGHLDLTDFIELTKLDLSSNYLTEITFPDNSKLSYLDLTNNNFSQSLEIFDCLADLKNLFIGNKIEQKSSKKEKLITKYKFKTGIYNKFSGSLSSLKKLKKLERLDISNTKIDNGLEYLPENLEWFGCQNITCEKVKEWIRKSILGKEKLLKEENERWANGLFSCLTSWASWDINECSQELNFWRRENSISINRLKEIESLLEIYNILRGGSFAHEREEKTLDVLIFSLEEEVIKIKKQVYSEQQAQVEISPKNNHFLSINN